MTPVDGLILFNKPILWTSHDVVNFIRRRVGKQKVGHAGTLDPLATGLLLILLGKWTKRSDEFLGMDKSYAGTILFGAQTDSFDMDGKMFEAPQDPAGVDAGKIEKIFLSLTGKIDQTPPVYSALKKDGEKLYELARRGESVAIASRPVEISEFKLNYFHENEASFSVSCSKGTYIRSLASEAGRQAGCGASLSSLVRTRIGPFRLEDAIDHSEFSRLGPQEIQGRANENLSRI